MNGRENRLFADMGRLMAAEAGQAVRRSLDLGLDAVTGMRGMTDMPGMAGASRATASSTESLPGRPARLVARGPFAAAYEAIDLACRVVETACDASRLFAGALLGQEVARPAPGGTSTDCPPCRSPGDGGGDSAGGKAGRAAAGSAGSDAASSARAARTSALLQGTGWVGRVAPPTTSSAEPGGTVRIPLCIENRTGTRMRAVRLRSTDLVSREGHWIDEDAVVIKPPIVDLPARSACAVEVTVVVPPTALPGRYTAVVSALGLPQASWNIQVEVR